MNITEVKAELAAHWRDWRRNWEKLPATDRNLRTAAVALTLIVIYGVVLRPLTNNRIEALDYEIQKQAKRQKSNAKAEAKPFTPPASLGGKSPHEAEAELAALKDQFDEVDLDLRRLNASFIPLDDSLAMNALKSGLTNLAEAGDMEVTAIEHVFARREDKERAPTPQMLKEAAKGNPFKRPLIVLRARASFRGLMQFLDGLNQLPYVAAPVGCDISIEVERNPETKAPIRQWLAVHIKFAV
jgi:hypothetical protein